MAWSTPYVLAVAEIVQPAGAIWAVFIGQMSVVLSQRADQPNWTRRPYSKVASLAFV
jgi:hypothetical protein